MSALAQTAVIVAGPADARPLVLLHGIGSNARSFAALIDRLSGDRRLVAWDCPGYGASAPLAMEWPTTDDYADRLAGLLAVLGIGSLDLLGHSMGALIAGRFAALHPGRVRRLVLSSPALGNGARPGLPLAPPAAARLDALKAEGAMQFAATRAPRLVHRRGDAALVAQVTEAMAEVKLPGYAHACHLLSCGDLVDDAARIATPTLVMVGARDEITPPANCRRVHTALAAATPALGHRFELVEEAGHAVAQEQPAAMAHLVEGWLGATGT